MDKYAFPCNPAPDPAAVVAGENFRFILINDVVLRYEWSPDGIFEDRASSFVINRSFPVPKYQVTEACNQLEIRTPSFHLQYDKKRFSPHGLMVSFSSKTTLWGAVWRYGDEPQDNLGGTARTLDLVDGRCDMDIGVLSRSGYSSIDDSLSMLFDGRGFVAPRRPGDRIDGYLFCYGHNYKAAIKSFYAISGRQPVLPRWTLGNWWSRYYAYSADEYIGLVDKFKEQAIPLSVAVLDMDWHYVNDERVPHAGWTGYSWNKSLFADPVTFGKELHNRKLKISLNDHPHAGIHHHEDGYKQMAEVLLHDTADCAPISFDPTCPKFMHAFLNVLHRSLEESCDVWWIDWQQGSYCQVPGLDPLWLLNHFQFLDHQLLHPSDSSVILSRYAGPGSHRYPVGFSGDTITTWASLQFQPEFTATASNVGYGWWSHDIGGHMKGIRDDELATRWLQFGVFSPILRLHSTESRWASKEPWLYRQENADIMSKFLQFRHRLVPYTFTMNFVAEDEPLVQPLYWRFPSLEEAYKKPNEYFFGRSLVIAPIVQPRNTRTNHASAETWVPPGRHVDIFTGCIYDGGRDLRMYRTLHGIPVLAPEGSIIPLDINLQPGNGCLNPSGYEVLVVIGRDGQFEIIEELKDDATRYCATDEAKTLRRVHIEYSQEKGRLEATACAKQWAYKFVSLMSVPSSLTVSINGDKVLDVVAVIEDHPNVPGMVVKIPEVHGTGGIITIDLGENPQLSVLDPLERIQHLLLDFQCEFNVKDEISAICKSSQPRTNKVGHLLSLGLDQDLIGPILELMLADSRGS
ncbi:putative alpha-xylosidase [Dactylonectria macrodidyma]|uniref:alpha-glucosidase n=1 Tax=Dactylonectria macrodidyma TaxID=307937 RepID=A0A9P9DYZ9_9HYPO|nr:putative alpha-xylosidase [Dactylonectria macrodidyma]